MHHSADNDTHSNQFLDEQTNKPLTSFYQKLVENCPTAFIISRQGQIIFVNRASLNLFGYEKSTDVLGTSVLEHVAPISKEETIERIKKNSQGIDIPKKYESLGLKSDGTIFPYEANIVNFTVGNTIFAGIFIIDISAHKKNEEKLIASEKKYKDLINQAASIILRWNTNGEITFFNEYAQKTFGFNDNVLGQNIVNTLNKNSTSGTDPKINTIFKNIKTLLSPSSQLEDIEFKTTTAKGKKIWITWKNSPVFNENQQLIEILSVGIDVTKRKEAEEKTKESEQELVAILDSLQDTYYRVNNDGYVVRVSPSVEELFGYNPKELKKIKIADLYIEPNGREHFLHALAQGNGKVLSYQAAMRHKNGNTIWISTNAHFCYDKNNNIIGIEGTTRNITKKRELEKVLKESEERFKAIFNAISDAVFFVGEDRKILLINPAVTHIFGYSFNELKNKSTEIIYSNKKDFTTLGENRFNTTASTSQPLYEISYLRKDGSSFIGESFGTKIEDNSGNFIGFIGIIRDISERKATHEKLRLSQKIFENAGKAILVTDEQARIIEVNEAFCDVTGYSRSELIGQPSNILLSNNYSDTFYSNITQILFRREYWHGELWGRKKDGSIYPILATINAVKNDQDEINNYITIFSDISDIKNTEKRLEQLAHFDQLTELPNRILFHKHLHSALERANLHNNAIAIMYIDIDGFKQVNDTLGHAEGDKLLVKIGKRLRNCVREEDTVARLGGDEFAIIINDLQDMNYLHNLSSRIVKELATTLNYESREIHVSGSIGVATYPNDGSTEEKLIQNADKAMYHAKQKGKNTYQFFDAEINAKMIEKIHLEYDLRNAIKNNELFIQYQPKYDLQLKQVVGIEALVRWQHPERGILSPSDFISIAENSALIFDLGKQVLEIACKDAKTWYDAGRKNMPVAINISAKEIRDSHFIEHVRHTIFSTNLPANLLEIEITESLLMEDIDKTIIILRELKDMGLKISIDDFGTGYSSLSYLKKLPVDTLKIDQSFVMDIANNDDKAIISAIISMAKNLNLRVIAEGVENKEQFEFLKNKLCHEIQGFLLSKPVFFEELEKAIDKIEKNTTLCD